MVTKPTEEQMGIFKHALMGGDCGFILRLFKQMLVTLDEAKRNAELRQLTATAADNEYRLSQQACHIEQLESWHHQKQESSEALKTENRRILSEGQALMARPGTSTGQHDPVMGQIRDIRGLFKLKYGTLREIVKENVENLIGENVCLQKSIELAENRLEHFEKSLEDEGGQWRET